MKFEEFKRKVEELRPPVPWYKDIYYSIIAIPEIIKFRLSIWWKLRK